MTISPHIHTWMPADLAEERPSTASSQDKETGAGSPAGFNLFRVSDWHPAAPQTIQIHEAQADPAKVSAGAPVWQPPELSPFELSFASKAEYGSHTAQGRVDEYLAMQSQAKAMLAQAESQVAAILNEARSQETSLLASAEQSAKDITQQAYLEGKERAGAETQQLIQAARAIVEEVGVWRQTIMEKSEMMMLRLVIEIAQAIFGDGLPLDPDTLGQAFSRALAQAKTLGDLRIYAHSEDVAMLSPHWMKQQTSMSGQVIELIPSDIIKRGGCFVEGEYGSVDARVETQFQLVQDTLFTTLSSSQAEIEAASK